MTDKYDVLSEIVEYTKNSACLSLNQREQAEFFYLLISWFFAARSVTARTAVTAAAPAYIFALFFLSHKIDYIKNDNCKNNGWYNDSCQILRNEFNHDFTLLMQRDDVISLSGQVWTA